MTWRRKSVDSDGSPNGDRKFASRQSPVPGVEANLTTILRNFHEQRPAFHCLPPQSTPSTRPLYGLFSRPGDKVVKPVFIHFSHENARSTPTTHTTRCSTLFNSYPQHVRLALLVPPSRSIASNSFISFSMWSCLPALYFYQVRYPHLLTRCISNTIVHHPFRHSSPFLFVAYDTIPLCAL